MRLVLLSAAGFVLAGVAGTALAAADLPQAGYWESTSKSSLSSSKTKRECLSDQKIQSYLTGPSNPHYTCRYDSRHIAGGHAAMEGECVDNNGLKSRVKVEGDYTATSFTLGSHLKVVIGGLTIPVTADVEAHRISAQCPMAADGGDAKPDAKD
jgi:hypothetical protein